MLLRAELRKEEEDHESKASLRSDRSELESGSKDVLFLVFLLSKKCVCVFFGSLMKGCVVESCRGKRGG